MARSHSIGLPFTFGATVALASASVLALVALKPAPAVAGSGRGFGIGIGIGVGAALLNEAAKAARSAGSGGGEHRSSGRKSRPSRDDDDDDDDRAASNSSKKSDEQRAADARNVAAQVTEFQEIERSRQMERERNVQQAVRNFVKQLEIWHKALREDARANVKASGGSNINQVTDGEVTRAVEDAYREARLTDFDKLAGELWTRDRLMVRILDISVAELDSYFKGVGVKGTSMADIRDIFRRSALHVYGQALQTAELVGVSYSFNRFIRTIYEQSDRADESLWTTGADQHYELLVANLVDKIPRREFISDEVALASDAAGLDYQFLFRFRARRALYDCMSARYAELISGGARGQGQTIQIAAKTTDGPRSGGVSAPGQANAGTSATGMSGSQPTEIPAEGSVWKRLKASVHTVCQEPLKAVLAQVKSGQVQPKPARWDSGGADSLNRRLLVPTQGGNPFQ